MAKAASNKKDSTAIPASEANLWAAVDALRNNMNAAEYKHVVLGPIFLKSISDAFEAKHARLEAQEAEGSDRWVFGGPPRAGAFGAISPRERQAA